MEHFLMLLILYLYALVNLNFNVVVTNTSNIYLNQNITIFNLDKKMNYCGNDIYGGKVLNQFESMISIDIPFNQSQPIYMKMVSINLITNDDELLYMPFSISISNNVQIPTIQKIRSDTCGGINYKLFSLVFYIKEDSFNTNLKIVNLGSSVWGLSYYDVSFFLCNKSCLKCSGPRTSDCKRCFSNYVLLNSLVNTTNNYCVCQGSNFRNSIQLDSQCLDLNNSKIFLIQTITY